MLTSQPQGMAPVRGDALWVWLSVLNRIHVADNRAKTCCLVPIKLTPLLWEAAGGLHIMFSLALLLRLST